MAIQLSNVIIAGNNNAEGAISSAPSVESVETPTSVSSTLVPERVDVGSLRDYRSNIRRNITPPDVTDADNPHVIVAGKAKKIGKTSAYMLDMLSLDD